VDRKWTDLGFGKWSGKPVIQARNKSFANTWGGVVDAAEATGARYPELVAAQWALESGWGKHTSGKNNFFGLKGSGSARQTQEVINGKTVTITASFIDFPDLVTCVSYLVSRWYKDWKDYKGVNNAADREEAARSLVEQGYATDPGYAEKLIALMNEKAPLSGEKPAMQPLKEKPLFRITATRPTFLKKRPVQATELGETEKVAVVKGRGYAVLAYSEVAADAHAQVELAAGSGTWYVFEPHWKQDQPIGEALPASVDWSDFNCLVTANLTVGEILQWDRRRIPGPNASVRARLLNTAATFQQIRDAWGQPLGVTSFYRPEPINTEVGGVPNSRHVSGEAMDVYPSNRSLEEFYQWIRRRWTGGLGDGRNRGFVHLDTRGGGGFVPGAGAWPAAEWLY
jgi:hypothetical protein